MDFLLIKKNICERENLIKEFSSTLNVFKKRGQIEKLTLTRDNFNLILYDGINSKCYFEEYQNGDFIVTLGTLFYKKTFGEKCLQPLYNDFTNGNKNLYNDLMGCYCVIVFSQGKLHIFNDFLGLMRVFNTDDYSIFSSSFLAIAKALKTKTPSTQEIFEYLIRGGMYGDKTILKEINLIPRSTIVVVDDKTKNKKLVFKHVRLPFYNDFNKMVDHISKEYLEVFKVIAKAFGTNITTALSGGYDSRLMVALLRRNGITPVIYVYGKENSSDVLIAKNIANKEGIDIEHIDRDTYDKIDSKDYANVLENNFYLFDGLGNIGIFDNGTDVITRKHRCEGGRLQLNGAGGEVWRNFWQLNASRKRPIDFVRHKWDIFNYKAYSGKFNKVDYFNNFTKKLESSINFHDSRKKLTRKEMEIAYPLYRYRYWQSMVNSINLRYSNTLMPLMETIFLYPSFDLPIKYKNNGVFEAALIKKIDPKMASYPSNYGHNFSDKVPISKRFKSLIMRNIPLILKPYLRYKFSKKNKGNMPYFLRDNYISQVVDLNNLFISEYVDIQKLSDSGTLSRALTLEYFFKNI